MSQKWYYLDGSETRGPFSRADLIQLRRNDQVDGQTLVWREGWADWIRLGNVNLQATPATPAPPSTSVEPPPLPTSTAKAAQPLSDRSSRHTSASRRASLALAIAFLMLASFGLGLIARDQFAFDWRSLTQANRPQATTRSAIIADPDSGTPTGPPTTPGAISPDTTSLADATSSRADVSSGTGPSVSPTVAEREVADSTSSHNNTSVTDVSDSLVEPANDPDTAASEKDESTPVVLVSDDKVSTDEASAEPSMDDSHSGGTSDISEDDESAATVLLDETESDDIDTGAPASAPDRTTEPTDKSDVTGYTVFQEIEVQRNPQFSIAGSVITQDLRYKLLSKLQVGAPDDQGRRTLDQVIVDTALISADELSKDSLEDSLNRLKGWQFTAVVNRRGEIVGWDSPPDEGREIRDVAPPGLNGFLMINLMDDDGWKELTQLSFFVPAPKQESWNRQMTHDFGPLGSWSGMTEFRLADSAGGLLRYDYVHDMTYHPPEKGADTLPFKILRSRFVPESASGRIRLNEQTGRVVDAEELFVLRGSLDVEMLGQAATVETIEQQTMRLRMSAENPWSRESTD